MVKAIGAARRKWHSGKKGRVTTQRTALSYSVDTGCQGVLTVTVGSTQHIYRLCDIQGRIEVQL
jgi:hypothetical protein